MSNSKSTTTSNPLRVIETVARYGTGTTAKEITDVLQIPQATAYRVVNALVADEYLARTSDLRGFALGHALSGLISAATPPTISTAARAIVTEFRSGKRFAVHLIMFRNASLRIADQDPDYPLSAVRDIVRHPHASAAGKLMLAELGDSGSPLLNGPLTKLTQHTITDRTQLEEQLAEVRLKSEAWEINELEQGSASLALPVRLPNGTAGGALCLISPSERFNALREHAAAARELTTRLASFLY